MRDILIREAKPGEASLVSYFYFKLFESEFDFNACTEQYFLHAVSEIFDDPQG